jgi:DNA-directed RNA polymerase subunit M/transcription elongation factor TFIIS
MTSIRKACLSSNRLSSKPPEEVDAIVRRIERSCYNTALEQCQQEFLDRSWHSPVFVGRYSALLYLYVANLDTQSSLGSTHLADAIADGKVPPEKICAFGSKDINPEASAYERGVIEVRQQQKVEGKFTTRYPCPKCFERKATYTEVQIRSADEPSSNRLVCLNCSNIWFKQGV